MRWIAVDVENVLVRTAVRTCRSRLLPVRTELAVMHAVKDDLKSGTSSSSSGSADDYREQLVDDETFERELDDYGQVTGIETAPGAFVSKLKSSMAQRATEIEGQFPENAYAEIVDGRLILRKPPRSEYVDAALRIDGMITEDGSGQHRGRHDRHRALAGPSQAVSAAGGADSRLEDLRMRVITTLFCYGCNLGPVQTAKSIKGLKVGVRFPG